MAKIPYSPDMYKNCNPVLALMKNIAVLVRKYGSQTANLVLTSAQSYGHLAKPKRKNKKNRQQRIAARARKAAKAERG